MDRACTDCLVLAEDQDELKTFKVEVSAGLSALPKRLHSRFFYDKPGSDLFRRITELPEYYLTNCELEILRRSGKEIVSLFRGKEFNLVELGSGDGGKVIHLIEPVLAENRRLTYLPIDLSASALEALTAFLCRYSPSLDVRCIVAEYSSGLEWIKSHLKGPTLALFLGSNLGNFDQEEAEEFLSRIRHALAPGDLLVIGLDLRKDIDTMVRAYNDSEGVTAQFNLNLLRRINQQLSGNFDPGTFRYYSTYNPGSGGIDSFLISLQRQSVFIRELCAAFDFEAGEPIYTEHSHKYAEAEIRRLAHQTGFVIEANFYDSRKYFVDSVWRVTG
jgi:L-histidine Nalpha-methyltransferase